MLTRNESNQKSKHLIAQFFLFLALWMDSAAASDIDSAIKTIVDDSAPDLLATFKQFHQNPELGFQEFETVATIAAHLENLGYPVTTGVGGTGVVSVFKNGPGPVVLFRGDMDALPVEELVEIDYASTKTMKDLAGETVPVTRSWFGHRAQRAHLLRFHDETSQRQTDPERATGT